MVEGIENENHIEDESELDAALQDSIDAVKAGQTLEEQPQGQTGETGATGETGEAAPTGATGATGEADGGSQVENKDGDELRIPNKGPFESDEAYEKRIELFDLVKRRKAATTPEARQQLTEQINQTKGELRTLGTEKPAAPLNNPTGETGATGATGEEDPTIAADKERLKQLGGMTKEEIDAYMAEKQLAADTKNTLDAFVTANKELQDPDIREMFFDFVENNYQWQGKTGKALMGVLDMARESYFKPSQSIQDRVLKGADVQGKVNAMQFPGSTQGNQSGLSADKKASLEELKSTGMSEEKALELLSD